MGRQHMLQRPENILAPNLRLLSWHKGIGREWKGNPLFILTSYLTQAQYCLKTSEQNEGIHPMLSERWARDCLCIVLSTTGR